MLVRSGLYRPRRLPLHWHGPSIEAGIVDNALWLTDAANFDKLAPSVAGSIRTCRIIGARPYIKLELALCQT